MNNYTELSEINKYLEKDALNQSFLKMILANSVRPFKQTVPMIIGTVFDSMLTSPHLTDDLFCVGLEKRPSDTIKGIVDEMYNEHLQWLDTRKNFGFIDESIPQFEDYRSDLIMKARIANYNKNWGDDAIWNAIRKDGEFYWNELTLSQGKTIVTQSEWDRCKELCFFTQNNVVVGKYFINQDNIEKFYQLPLYWQYKGLKCKGLLDILLLEEETKTIYCVDIKTTSAPTIEQWFDICRNKNYTFQMSWYYQGIEANYKHLIEDGWKIKMRWMVIPTSGPFKPWIVPVTSEMLLVGQFGYNKVQQYSIDNIYYDSVKTLKGWEQAIDIYTESKLLGLKDYDIFYYYNSKLSNEQSRNLFF